MPLSANPTTPTATRPSFRFSRKQCVALVAACTVFGALAQVLIKSGANVLTTTNPMDMLTNVPLVGGYSLYGLSTILLVLALRDGELSILYPVISLTYVWVAILSFIIFHESLNPIKLAGICTIVVGVGVLGRNNHK